MKNKLYTIIFLGLSLINTTQVIATPYTIKNIAVQSKGESSALAKQTALKIGRKQAFQEMIQKLVNKKDINRFESASDQTIEFLIDSLQVGEERIGPKSYKALVSFDFNKQRLEDFLRNNSVPFIVPVHKSILILPVLSDGAKTYLFEKENIWLDLWRRHSFNQALVTFVVPSGDLSDISVLDAEDALIGATHKLISIIQRYQVSSIVVPYVSIVTADRHLNIRLDFQEYDSKGIKKNNVIQSHSLSEIITESSKTPLLKKLLPIAIENIQDFCKTQFVGAQQHNLIYLKIPTASSKDYYKYIALLNESSMVQEVQPVELSRSFSILRVRTLYTMEDLLNYLKQHGYNFEASQDIANPYAYEASKPR